MLEARVVLALSISVALAACVGCGSKAVIDPRAGEALMRMSDALGGADSFSFTARNTADHALETGQIVQLHEERKVFVRRPSKLLVEAEGEAFQRSVLYDGRTLTVLDRSANEYAEAAVSGTIGDMLDYVADRYDLTVPLADLFFRNPYETLVAGVEKGSYIGLHEVDGHPCHHLAFRQPDLDWQIWIDAVGPPVPRKLVIVHTKEEGCPSYSAVMDHWNLKAELKDAAFELRIPAGAGKVPMSDLIRAGKEGR